MIITNCKKKRELEEIFILEGFLDLIKLTSYYLNSENDIIFQFLNIIKSILLKIELLLIFDKIKNEITLILENSIENDNLVNTSIFNIILILIKSENLQIRFYVKTNSFFYFFIILFKKFRIYLVELEKLLFGKNIFELKKFFSKIQDFIYFIDDFLKTNTDIDLENFVKKIFFKEILFDIILPNFCEIGNLNCLGQNISLMILTNFFIIIKNESFLHLLKKSLFKTKLKIGTVNYLYLEKYFFLEEKLIQKILDINLFEEKVFEELTFKENTELNKSENNKNINLKENENFLKSEEKLNFNNNNENNKFNQKIDVTKIENIKNLENNKNLVKKVFNFEKTLFLENLIQLLQSKDDNLTYLTTNFIIILISFNFEFSENKIKLINSIIFERLNSDPLLRLITFEKILDLIFVISKNQIWKKYLKKQIIELSENIIIRIKKLILNKNYNTFFYKFFRKILKTKKKIIFQNKKDFFDLVEIVCIYNYQFENEQDVYFKNINLEKKYNLTKKEYVIIYFKMFIYIFNLRYEIYQKKNFDNFVDLNEFIDFSKSLEKKDFYFLEKNDLFEFEINDNPFIVFFTGFLDSKRKIKIFFSGLGYKFFIFQNFENKKKIVFISNFAEFEILKNPENLKKIEFFDFEKKENFEFYFNSEESKNKAEKRITFILDNLYQKEKDVLMSILLRFGQELFLIK